MAKKTRKREVVEDEAAEDILLHNIEISTKKNWFCNFKIHNEFELTDVHRSFMDLFLYKDTKMVFVDGPAGSAKSYLAVYGALQLLQKKSVNQIVYIRSIVESASKSLGSLPGELQDKFQPWSLPLIEKLDELVGPKVGGELIRNNYIKCMPVNFVRGLTFRDSVVIVDESQNMSLEENITILTRFGTNSKYIVIGDTRQSDIGNKSGFRRIYSAFNSEQSEKMGIHAIEFTKNEVVRSEILRFIVGEIDNIRS